MMLLYINQQIIDANWPFEYDGTAFKVYPWDPNESEDGLEVAGIDFTVLSIIDTYLQQVL